MCQLQLVVLCIAVTQIVTFAQDMLFEDELEQALTNAMKNQTQSSRTCDGVNFFKCDNGNQCIPRIELCDGHIHCSDASDETIRCREYVPYCPKFAFTCAYGACVDGKAKCNGIQDCADNSDENTQNCANITTSADEVMEVCGVNQHVCANSQCIDKSALCDGVKHCRDGSDETYQACSKMTCPLYTFRCSYGACAHRYAKCNDIVDCVDKSDEDPDMCRAKTSTTSRPLWVTYVCMLPRPPKNGKYAIVSTQKLSVGNVVEEGTYLSYSCNKNYALTPSVVNYACYRGQWTPSGTPRCVGSRRTPWWQFYKK